MKYQLNLMTSDSNPNVEIFLMEKLILSLFFIGFNCINDCRINFNYFAPDEKFMYFYTFKIKQLFFYICFSILKQNNVWAFYSQGNIKSVNIKYLQCYL